MQLRMMPSNCRKYLGRLAPVIGPSLVSCRQFSVFVCCTLTVSFLLVGYSNANSDLERRFFLEAPREWARYIVHFNNSSAAVTFSRVNGDGGASSPISYFRYARNGAIVIATANTKVEKVNCWNDTYGFSVTKRPGQTKWTLNHIGRLQDRVALSLVDSVILNNQSLCPVYLERQPLGEVVASDFFRLISIGSDEVPGFSNIVRVEFECLHDVPIRPEARRTTLVQRGTIWLDPDNGWAIVKAVYESSRPGFDSDDFAQDELEREELYFEFEEARSLEKYRLPVLQRHTFIKTSGENNRLEVLRTLRWHGIETPASELFRLPYYGLPEPKEFRSTWPRWPIVVLVGGGFVVIGVMIRRNIRKT